MRPSSLAVGMGKTMVVTSLILSNPASGKDFATDAETGAPVKHDLCEMLHIDEPNILRALKNRHAGAQPSVTSSPTSTVRSEGSPQPTPAKIRRNTSVADVRWP